MTILIDVECYSSREMDARTDLGLVATMGGCRGVEVVISNLSVIFARSRVDRPEFPLIGFLRPTLCGAPLWLEIFRPSLSGT